MTKRYIVATFVNGEAIDRTTTNENLKFGWRVISAYGKTILKGFSSKNATPPDAVAALKNYPGSGFQITDAVDCEKPKPVKTKATKQPLTEEQLAHVLSYAHANGRRWKIRLSYDWERSASPTAVLQALRNSHGPSWLKGFVKPKAK